MVESLVTALQQDPRVTAVKTPKVDDEWCDPWNVFPSPASQDGVVTGSDGLHGVRFSNAIEFSVDVPVKNQRRIIPAEDIPRHYDAIWDGVALLVSWLTPDGDPMPMSGGHVVSDILSDACEKAGMRLYVQGCNAACKYEFAHTSIRFGTTGKNNDVEFVKTKFYAEVEVLVPGRGSDLTGDVFLDIAELIFEFTALKNLGRRILEIERDGREAVARLLAIDVERSKMALSGPKGRIKGALRMRGWRRASRREIARLWAALANIELIRRQWDALRFPFDQEVRERGRDLLFARDYADEVDRVASFNPEVLRAAVQESATRLDNRALFLVTGAGAIAGAIAGGIVGVILGG